MTSSPKGSQTDPLKTLRHVADIAHYGGLANLSEGEALVAIRKLTLPHRDRGGSELGMRVSVQSALDAAMPAHTPVPQFDEGQNMNDLERQIRSEAVRAVLADIDAVLDRRLENTRQYIRGWMNMSHLAYVYDRVAVEIEVIRREIAELGEK